jgi:Carboxypeptidase regulatory-like domain
MNLVLRVRLDVVFSAFAVFVFLIIPAFQAVSAQSASSATITGRALDPAGASVGGAEVDATNTETGITRTTTTTTDGLFRFENLQPGIYDVLISATGFNKAEAKAVKLLVGDARDVNFSLTVAGAQQTLIVSTEVPLIEATKTDTSTVIDDKAMAELPTTTSFAGIGGVANDYQGLAASAPGVRYDYAGDSSDIVGPGSVSDRGVMVNIDGGNISDQVISTRDALGASVEEVKEFQVLTNNYNAEYGQAGNVILNVITKSGTNEVHGDFHAYFRGRNLGASSFFYNQVTCDPTLTGPGSCDTAADAGFPDSRAPFFKHEYGFTAGGPFVKDRFFWFGSLEKVHQGAPSTTTPFGVSQTVTAPTDELLWSGKIDAKITEKHTFTARYNVQRDLQSNLIVQTGGNTDPSGFVSQVGHDLNLNMAMISTPTSHTVNEARFAWHRFLSQTPTVSTAPGQGLPNAYVGADFCCPQGALQNRYQYIDNLTWVHGEHTVKAGVNISHFPYSSLFQQYHYGEFGNFDQNFLCAPYGLCPTEFTTGAGPGFVKATDNIYGLYVQDGWRIRRNVTINYGLRYDIENGAFQGGTIQDNTVKGGCLQANGLIPACGSDKNNFQPRLGVAWSPDFSNGLLHTIFGSSGQSVVRAAVAEITMLGYLNIALDSLNFDGINLLTANIAAPATSCFLPNGSVNPTPPTADAQACAVLSQYPNHPTPESLAPYVSGTISNFGRVRPISTSIKNPEMRMASLTIQRQLGQSFVFSVGYQGVFGFGLYGETDQNLTEPVPDPLHPGYFYMVDRPDSSFGAVRTNNSDRTSGYNALVVTAQQRLAHHVQFQASYTFSKTLATGEDFFGLSEPANPFITKSADRALAQEDIRHLANFAFIVDSNNVFHKEYVGPVLNNWTFSVLGTLQSGRPYPVSTGNGVFSGSTFFALGSETQQRPNVCVGGTSVTGCAGAPNGALVATNIGDSSGNNLEIGPAGVAACMNPGSGLGPVVPNCAALQTTFAAPAGASSSGPLDSYAGTPVDFQYFSGNLGRNAGQSLPLYRFDISLQKSIPVPHWESARIELKLDVFNIFNHNLFILNNANDALNFFAAPSLQTTDALGNTINNPDFNCTSVCINPFTGLYLGRNGQPLTLATFKSGRADKSLNAVTTNYLGLGDPAGVVTPRIMQLSIRFRW